MSAPGLSSADIERKAKQFWSWNGDDPAPKITHWTSRGTFTIRPCTPGRPPTTEVLFNNRHLGYGGGYIVNDALNLYRGSYDQELGFKASEVLPAEISQWNDLGG